MRYCESIFTTKRWKTREVMVGSCGVGGANPVRIQSMTTTPTHDVEATIEQIIRLSEAGCEIARVTVQGMREADACEAIKHGLLQRGYTIPLVADIHFFPRAALRVVDVVDKVRINPGNFVDKRASFTTKEYSDATYAKELEKIEEKFTPLVEKCKRLKRAMRIGTNHGSLSDRIMNRFGDTPRGMVESALEFARVCRQNAYHDFMFSMKSSNPKVMIEAYRLLVAEMIKLGWDYPLHLGVTEAGAGEDGRVKSAVGIGSLLLDGLGDTVRVSLTEDPCKEIDPCQRLVSLAKEYEKSTCHPFEERYRSIDGAVTRSLQIPKTLPLHPAGSVFLSATEEGVTTLEALKQLAPHQGQHQSLQGLVFAETCSSVKGCVSKEGSVLLLSERYQGENLPLFSLEQAKRFCQEELEKRRFSLSPFQKPSFAVRLREESVEEWHVFEEIQPTLIFFSPAKSRLHTARHFFEWLQTKQLKIPVILSFNYTCAKEDLVLRAAAEFGALFCDGLGDGICLEGPYETEFLRTLSFTILQAARMRTSKTEFISCPSCGRTLFDLQEVSEKIRARTKHLPGVKIAIMGCIVNGPGEMADADFGYVGSKPGKIDLYVGKECVEKDIDFSEAEERLVALIQEKGCWVEPEVPLASCSV